MSERASNLDIPGDLEIRHNLASADDLEIPNKRTINKTDSHHTLNRDHTKRLSSTTSITRCGGKIVHVKKRGCRILVHAFVSIRLGIQRRLGFVF